MSIRWSHIAMTVLLVAAVLLMSGRSWAVYYGLGPSNDEWKLKYDVEINPADGDTLSVVFILADEGRLKPIYSMALIVFSQQTDSRGGRSYDLKRDSSGRSPRMAGVRGRADTQGTRRPRPHSVPHPDGRRQATTIRCGVL